MPFARCPLCDDILNIDATLGLNHPVTCSTCLSNLRIVSLDPCELEEVRRPARPNPPPNNPNPGRQGSGNYQRGPGGGSGGKPASQGGSTSGHPASHPDGHYDSRSDNRPGSTNSTSNDRRPAQPPRDRRLIPPPPMALPPNPDKLAEVKRPQRWERPKNDEEEDFEDTDHDELDELEDKIFRKRSKKNK
jgi:hypothetical protein